MILDAVPRWTRARFARTSARVCACSCAGIALLATACSVLPSRDAPRSAVRVASLRLSPDSQSVPLGGVVAFRVAARDSTGNDVNAPTVVWTTTDPTLAMVTPSGEVTASGMGRVYVRVIAGEVVDSSLLQVGPPVGPLGGVMMSINTSIKFPISRYVYGMNFTAETTATGAWQGARPPAEVTFDRFGGNRLSAYNWENNFSNAGRDYKYQNDALLSASTTPGEAVRWRAAAALDRGAAVLLTVPMLGYVAADGAGPVDTLDATRAARLATRFKVSKAAKGSALTLAPNTGDGFVYQDEFVHWIDKTFPGSFGHATRPIFLSLDNEPDLWHSTHKEILPDSGDQQRMQTYDGLIATTIEHARAIKRVAPKAVTFGPAVATYAGLLTLGRYPHPDPVYGSRSFVETYLDELRAEETRTGQRLVDVLDLHWYPAAGTEDGEITNDWAPQDSAMLEARLQAPRSLWDPHWDEKSWVSATVGGPIQLLPRLRNLVADHYPGTKIAVTEYYYGRGGDISGALAQADVLGIFGREGVFAASVWPHAGVDARPYNGDGAKAYAYLFGAFRMFLNYDGVGGRFGDTGVSALTSDTRGSSVYASLDAAGRLVAVVVNKRAAPLTVTLAIGHDRPLTAAQLHTLTSASPNPQRVADLPVSSDGTLTHIFPALSVSTLVIRP